MHCRWNLYTLFLFLRLSTVLQFKLLIWSSLYPFYFSHSSLGHIVAYIWKLRLDLERLLGWLKYALFQSDFFFKLVNFDTWGWFFVFHVRQVFVMKVQPLVLSRNTCFFFLNVYIAIVSKYFRIPPPSNDLPSCCALHSGSL